MSTHSMFSLRNKKNIDTFWLKKHLIKSCEMATGSLLCLDCYIMVAIFP